MGWGNPQLASGAKKHYAVSSMSTSTPSAGTGADDRLESWKEIAVFLRRDIRTVQRWEKTEGMPVHRHQHDKLGSIYAFKSELVEWQRQRAEEPDDPDVGADNTAPVHPAPAPAPSETKSRSRGWYLVRALYLVVVVAVVAAVTAVLLRPTGEPGSVKILVLPFANLSGDPAQEYFSEGVTEELITSLARQTDGMRVTSLGSSLVYKDSTKTPRQIGQELKVDYVVTGSVRRSGDRVRISAHLLRTRDEAHVWDDNYDREITDILGLQSDVAAAITDGIRLRLRPHQPSRRVNPAAYEAYLKGRFFWNRRSPESTQEAISYFQKSIADDSNYAPAYVGLADCYSLLGSAQMGALPPRVAMPQAKEAVLKALKLDPELAEAHASLAHIKLIFDWDFSGADAEFRRAIQLNPDYATAHQWYALYFNATGQPDEALKQLKIAEELDPLSPVVKISFGDSYYFARKYPESEKAAREALDFNPDYALAQLVLGRALERQKKYPAAMEAFQRGWQLAGHAPALTAFVAHAYATSGDAATARKMAEDLEALTSKPNGPYISPLYIATIYTGLGDLDSAFKYLNKAADERCEYLVYLQHEPMADPLRGDSRFDQLLVRNKLK